MRRDRGTGAIKTLVGLVLALALAAGTAWALETQSATTPAGDRFTSETEIIPDGEGAYLGGEYVPGDGEMPCEDDEFSVRFDEETYAIVINGTTSGVFETNHHCLLGPLCPGETVAGPTAETPGSDFLLQGSPELPI